MYESEEKNDGEVSFSAIKIIMPYFVCFMAFHKNSRT